MLRNPKYVYGPQNTTVPANLNFGDFILTKFWEHRQNIALINGATDERLTYGDIAQQTMNFAISLTRMGVRKGDTIGLMSENRQEFWCAVLGVACAGAVLTTISTGYVKGEIIHVTNISKPKYIICSPVMYKLHDKTIRSMNFVKKIILFGEEKHHDVVMYNDLVFENNGHVKNVKYEEFQSVEVQGQTDTLTILYSSGTTGLPKGVMTTHLNVIAACCMPATTDPRTISLMITPWYHVMGLVGMLSAFVTGRTAVYLAKFDVDTYLKTIEKYKAVQLTVVPPILVAVCKNQSKYDLSSVKMIYSGAAPLHKDTINSVHEKFPNLEGVYQGYGATEMTLGVLKSIPGDPNTYKFGSVGVVVPNTVIKVTDLETGKPLGPNEPGEICAKGQLLMKGYVGRNRGSDFDDEGFYKTGDVGYYDDDRYFFIVDRVKELIKYKGYQVPPAELEAVLLQHEGIRDAAVIGVEDRTAGEVPLAFVVAQPGKTLTEAEVKEFVAERLSNPKHLRGGVRFVQQIPKLASGKLLRKELRKMLKTAKSRLFPNLEGVYQGYGATEMTLGVLKSIPGDPNTHKFGSVGVVVPNTVIKVTDLETGKPLGANEPGEICAKGQLLMKGYVGRNRGSDFDDEGFYKTGDVGYYDDDRYFFIVDRVKELIKYKGYQVPPAELEAVLLQHEGIRDAAVIGVEDRTAGEVTLAFVVAQPGKKLTEAEVKEFVAERLSNPKHLRGGVRFVQQIPKLASGKLLRMELRKMLKTAKSRL